MLLKNLRWASLKEGSGQSQMPSTFRCLVLLAGLYATHGIFLPNANAQEDKSVPPPAQGTPKPKAKKIYTNEDLKNLKNTTPVNQSPATKRSETTGRSRAGGIDGYRDKRGHDREYWQKRLLPLDHQLRTLDSQIASQQAKYDHLTASSGVKISRSGKLHANSSDTRTQVEKRIADLKQKRADVLRSRQDLEEEARKAEALPEWLR